MAEPYGAEIRTKLAQRRRRDRAEMRRKKEAVGTFAVQAVEALTEGLGITDEDANSTRQDAVVETAAMAEAHARDAIEARRLQPLGPERNARPGEPPLRIALRRLVASYAEPLVPTDRTIVELEQLHGVALAEEDADGLWAGLQLEAALAVRALMPDVIEIATTRAESVIIAELVAAEANLLSEYPDAPRPYTPDTASGKS